VIILGQRTTVFAVLEAYPFLEEFLQAYHPAFGRVSRPGGRTAWARMTTLGDVAVEMDVTWRRVVRDLCDEVARSTGTDPPVNDLRRAVAGDDRRLAELREIAARLEDGGSLVELAARLRDVTAGVDAKEAVALDRALAAAAAEARAAAGRSVQTAIGHPADTVVSGPPEGHPLDSLRREGQQVRELCAGLREELERLGGSPSRRRWRVSRPLVARLVERLAGVETRFRREQQAWFPALAVLGEEGPAVLMRHRQSEALEARRRLRLAVARDDAVSAVESGLRLLDLLGGLAATEEQVLDPIAERLLSPGDWAAVRELEDGVGWSLIAMPPRWPGT
jgi:DUF438 domain-containing protein